MMDGVSISRAARKRRHALLDAYLQGAKQKDLAKAHGVTAPAIWSQINRARRERLRLEEIKRERAGQQLTKVKDP